jgi:DNA-binding NarL/FixJ family response regulator
VAFGLTLAILAGGRGASRDLDAPGVVLALAATLPLLARRRSPLAVFAVTAAASAALNGLGYAQGPPFGPTVALFFVASDERTRSRLRDTAAVVLAVFAVHLAATAASEGGFPTTPILFGVVVWGGAWVLGDQIAQRRQRQADLAERASRAERDTLREARLAAAEERTRIARDLHDSAAHAINVILVQAGAARLLQERDPSAVREALATIEDVARETIGDIDQLIRGLREDDVGEPIEAPAGLAAVATLARGRRPGRRAGAGPRPRGRPGRLPHRPGVAHERGPPRRRSRVGRDRLRPGRPGADCHERDRRRGLADRAGRPRHPRDARAGRAARRDVRGRGDRRHVSGACPAAVRGAAVRAMSPGAVRVLLVDDDDLMRAGLRAVLRSDPDVEVVGEAANGRSAVTAARTHRPDVVLMDVRMPDLDGIAATREVLSVSPEIRVLILTTFEQDDYIFGALSAGASGFLLKRTSPEELLAAIRTVAAGDSLLSPSVTRIVVDRVAREPLPSAAADRRLDDLTPREREVLALIARGLTNGEIGAELVIEESTVKTHVKRILMKLGLRDRIQAVIFAYESGLTQPGSHPAS